MEIKIREKFNKFEVITDGLIFDVLDTLEDAETTVNNLKRAEEIKDEIDEALDEILNRYTTEELKLFVDGYCMYERLHYNIKTREIE